MQREQYHRRAALLVALLATLACPAIAAAQGASLTPLVGWQWGGTLDYPSGDVHANAALSYGGALTVPVRPGYSGEIMYTYQSTHVIGRPNVGGEFELFDMGTHYIQINGVRELGYGDTKATPFILGGLGTTIFAPGESSLGNFNTQWLFSISVGGGVMVQANERVGLRLQARFLLPMNYTSGGAYFGTGGSGFTISGGSAMPQGDASLGLTFKLGQ